MVYCRVYYLLYAFSLRIILGTALSKEHDQCQESSVYISLVISVELWVSTLKYITTSSHMLQVVWRNVLWAPTWLLFRRQPFLISTWLPTNPAFSFNFPSYLQANSGKVYFEECQRYILSDLCSPLHFILNKLCSWNSVIKCVGICQWVLSCCCCCCWSSSDGLGLLVCSHSDRTPWMGDEPIAVLLPIQDNTKKVCIHAPSVIRNYDPSVWANEDSSCHRPRGHCDRRVLLISCIICLLDYNELCS
jgi:hypothetical protein